MGVSVDVHVCLCENWSVCGRGYVSLCWCVMGVCVRAPMCACVGGWKWWGGGGGAEQREDGGTMALG